MTKEEKEMDQSIFERLMIKARTMAELGEKPDYWQGYQRGLRRRYHGEKFGTDEEHELWMNLHEDLDPARADRGRGYRAGYIPEYCTQNEGNCRMCSLVNYGLDCVNNPIGKG
jgi:hypothetical protein